MTEQSNPLGLISPKSTVTLKVAADPKSSIGQGKVLWVTDSVDELRELAEKGTEMICLHRWRGGNVEEVYTRANNITTIEPHS